MLRAIELGLPMFLGILGGTAEHWARYGRAYREAWAETGHPAEAADIAVAVHGFVGDDDRQAKATYPLAGAAHVHHRRRRYRPRRPPPDRPRRQLPNPAAWCSSADPTRSPTGSST